MFQNSITEGENLQGQKLSIVEETMSDSYQQLNTITIALSGYMYIHVSLHPYSGANQAVVQRWKDHLIVLEQNITSNVAFLTSNIFTVRMKKAWVLSYPLSAQWRLWSDWTDAQADLSLRWAHSHFVGFVMSQLNLFTYVHRYT